MTWAELLLAAMAGAFGGLSAHLAFRYRMREKLEEWLQVQIETRPLYQREEAEASSAAHVKTTDAPEGFKANPLFVETKSRRMQLLVQPSLYDAIKARATAEGQSVNELVHSILEAAIKGG